MKRAHDRPFPNEKLAAAKVVPLAARLARRDGPARPEWLTAAPPTVRALFTPATEAAVPAPEGDPAARRAIDEARAEAEAEGLRSAQAKVDLAIGRYLDGVKQAAEQVRRAASPRAEDVVALALVVAREILGRELTVSREPLLAAVDEALAAAGNARPVTVRLGPVDMEYVRRHRPDLAGDGIDLQLDERLALGGCVVESPQQVIDASFEARLQAAYGPLAAELSLVSDDEAEPFEPIMGPGPKAGGAWPL